jgi:hypothetical protein
MAAILLARRIAAGHAPAPGAVACAGMLGLDEFAPLFAHWRMQWRIEESIA